MQQIGGLAHLTDGRGAWLRYRRPLPFVLAKSVELFHFGVPLYSGFMYASVASFLLGFWKQLRAEVTGWPHPGLVALVGGAIYLNFFTHHLGPDLRWPLMGIVLLLFWRTRPHQVNTELVRVWPVTATFAGLGLLIWVAENLATFLGAWAYPDQGEAWQPVHLRKVSSWALLVIISFILVTERRVREQLRRAA